MEVTTSICHGVRNAKDPKKQWPVVIQVTHNRKPHKWTVKGTEKITAADFDKLFSPNVRPELREIRKKAEKELERANLIIDEICDFTFKEFSRKFLISTTKGKQKSEQKKDFDHGIDPSIGHPLSTDISGNGFNQVAGFSPTYLANSPSKDTPNTIQNAENSTAENKKYSSNYETPNVFLDEFEEPFKTNFRNQYGGRKYPKVKSLIDFNKWGEVALVYGKKIAEQEERRHGNTINMFNSLISLLHFKKSLAFKDVTRFFLEDYQQWLLDQGNSISTVGIYLRPLRTIFNDAIDDGLITETLYPFGRRKYIIPGSDERRKAISTESLRKLYYSEPVCWQEEMYKDFFFFIYFGNGMNPKDMALLTFSKIVGDFIYFFRAKTIRTSGGNIKKVSVFLNPDLKRIITKWGKKYGDAKDYIFPILKPGLKPYKIRDLIQLFIKRINFWMRRIADREGIMEDVTTICGRKTTATQLRDSNIDKEFIRGILGHIDDKSIKNYFAEYTPEDHKRYISHLEYFKNSRDEEGMSESDLNSLLRQIQKFLTQKTKIYAAQTC
jgi:integrase/recombinase XerD